MAISPLSPEYKEPKTASQFVKLEIGTTKLRILDSGIAGFEAWTLDNKPVRLPMNEQGKMEGEFKEPIKNKRDKDEPDIKVFWAFTVWNYETESIQIWSFTQAGIRKAIIALRQDPDFSDILKFDIKITKTKTGSEATNVEYSVLPGKESELPDEAREAIINSNIDLNKLFVGEYPMD